MPAPLESFSELLANTHRLLTTALAEVEALRDFRRNLGTPKLRERYDSALVDVSTSVTVAHAAVTALLRTAKEPA